MALLPWKPPRKQTSSRGGAPRERRFGPSAPSAYPGVQEKTRAEGHPGVTELTFGPQPLRERSIYRQSLGSGFPGTLSEELVADCRGYPGPGIE